MQCLIKKKEKRKERKERKRKLSVSQSTMDLAWSLLGFISFPKTLPQHELFPFDPLPYSPVVDHTNACRKRNQLGRLAVTSSHISVLPLLSLFQHQFQHHPSKTAFPSPLVISPAGEKPSFVCSSLNASSVPIWAHLPPLWTVLLFFTYHAHVCIFCHDVVSMVFT